MKEYSAPWSPSLIAVSTLATLVCLGLAVGLLAAGPGRSQWLGLLPLLILLACALFSIRGYSLTASTLRVHRPFWTTQVSLANLSSARFEPSAMRWSLRLWGNGGLFSITGFFFNRPLGRYRAWVTDPHRTVVLRFPTRTLLISPSEPEEFINHLRSLLPMAHESAATSTA